MGSLRTVGATIALSLIAVLALTASPTFAQDATPGASPEASPVAGISCTDALGIGAAGDACVNVVHASPDAPAVDVYVDRALALSNLPFGQASGWVALPAGEHQVDVVATGTDIGTAVISAVLPLESGTAYEVAAVGLLASISPLVNTVDFANLASDSARVRVVHASPDAPAIDIALAGGDVLISNLAFPTPSAYLDVPAGTYDFEVRPTGTTDIALPITGVAFEAGTITSVYAIGQVADGTLTVLPVVATTTGAAGTGTPEASPVASPAA